MCRAAGISAGPRETKGNTSRQRRITVGVGPPIVIALLAPSTSMGHSTTAHALIHCAILPLALVVIRPEGTGQILYRGPAGGLCRRTASWIGTLSGHNIAKWGKMDNRYEFRAHFSPAAHVVELAGSFTHSIDAKKLVLAVELEHGQGVFEIGDVEGLSYSALLGCNFVYAPETPQSEVVKLATIRLARPVSSVLIRPLHWPSQQHAGSSVELLYVGSSIPDPVDPATTITRVSILGEGA